MDEARFVFGDQAYIRVVRISIRDQVEDLIKNGRDIEKAVLSRAATWHMEHRFLCYGNKTIVFDEPWSG